MIQFAASAWSISWEVLSKPTEPGGLGMSDLKLTGYALQAPWLWLQKTDQDRAWSQLRTDQDRPESTQVLQGINANGGWGWKNSPLLGRQLDRWPVSARLLPQPQKPSTSMTNLTKQFGVGHRVAHTRPNLHTTCCMHTGAMILIPRTQTHMENMGAAKSEDFPVASVPIRRRHALDWRSPFAS